MHTVGGTSYPTVPEEPNRVDGAKENKPIQNVANTVLKRQELVVKPIQASAQKLDQTFIPSRGLYKAFYSQLEELATQGMDFQLGLFLTGLEHADNTVLLDQAKTALKTMARTIASNEGLDLTAAYKKVIGLLDRYDEKAQGAYRALNSTPKSTFYIRSALLYAAQEDNANIDSWMVYTKKGKPSSLDDIWEFLDDWKNWVPEAQGKIAKFIEAAAANIRTLSHQYADNDIVLMKGGYGAGKTRMTETLFAEQKDAVVAPDKAKEASRRSMPKLTHARAHIEGSQIAYKLFDACIRTIKGTVVYDSSLNNPHDITGYIKKNKDSKRFNPALSPLANGQPVLKIYDVARKDEARFLAVLRRDFQGEDPRIPPHLIKLAAVKDKMNRLDCMKAVINETGLNVEYNFMSGDSSGWNTDFVAKLQSCRRPTQLKQENIARLALEGFLPESFVTGVPKSTLSKEKVEADFDQIFQQPVYKIMQGLSPQENSQNEQVFSSRILLGSIVEPITAIEEIYPLLHPAFKAAIAKEAFEKAFEGINKADFLKDINEAKRLTYLELPFITAASIHCQLTTNPF